jgi:hypothetical protein
MSEKITRIKAHAQARTLKKAFITADQLRRRYAFLENALKTEPRAGNPILSVVKWNASLDPLVQTTLEQAEPLTWLKHLHAKRPDRGPRFPWHVTALLFEEQVRAQARLAAMAMETIPEDVSHPDSPLLPGSSPEQAQFYHPYGLHSFRDHLHPSLSRRRSDEDHISFEPIVEPSRKSLDDSRHSSPYTGIFGGSRSRGASPSSSRYHFRDLAARVRRKGIESDDASSPHQSASEDNGRSPGKARGTRRHFFKSLDLDLEPPETAVPEPAEMRTPGLGDNSAARLSSEDPRAAFQRLDTSSTVGPTPRRHDRLWRGPRTSLPLSPQVSWREQEQVDEEAEQREYERRVE